MSETEDDTQVEGEETSSGTAVAESSDSGKMSLDVQIDDGGPCQKHVRVKISQADVSRYFENAVSELCGTASVPGFRPGRVPKKLIQRRFRTELSDQVKQNLLVDSMEQLAEEHELDPINEPNIDVESLKLPEDGDFEYEFDVEVRPEFDIPDYAGLTLERPTREITDKEIDNYLDRFLSQYGQLVPQEGAAQAGDSVSMSIEFKHNDETIHKISEETAQLKPVLRFRDAEFEGFAELLAGAEAGDTREAELTVSPESESIEMRGEKIQATFTVNDVKRLRLPELDKEFLARIGFESEEELRGEIRSTLNRQVTYEQRQSARSQVIDKITESANWDLPEQLVLRQVENALRREMLEMQQAGFTRQEIQARENEIRQRAVSTTRQALKEHFVLDKIATTENIEVDARDIETEIRLMATQSGESPRRVRARLVKSGMIENLEAQISERKAIDFILDKAQYEDVEMDPPAEDRIEAISHSVCGLTFDAPSSSGSKPDESEKSEEQSEQSAEKSEEESD